MPFAIQTVDKPNSGALRAKVRDEHLKYLDANMHRLLAAGAVINDDGTGGKQPVHVGVQVLEVLVAHLGAQRAGIGFVGGEDGVRHAEAPSVEVERLV